MHPLYDVPAVVEHPPNVLSVYSTCEVRITVVLPVPTRCTDALQHNHDFIGARPLRPTFATTRVPFSTLSPGRGQAERREALGP